MKIKRETALRPIPGVHRDKTGTGSAWADPGFLDRGVQIYKVGVRFVKFT